MVSWGRSQVFLPLFLLTATVKCLSSLWKDESIKIVYLGDPVLSPLGALLKALFDIPVVVTVHGRDIVFSNRLYQYLLPKFLARMDRIVCVSEEIKRQCLNRGLAQDLCVVIPNGIDVEDFAVGVSDAAVQAVESKAGIQLRDRTVLLSVGRLVEKKGIPYFVTNVLPKILEKRQDLCYVIVGDGPQRGHIVNLVKKEGLEDHVRLLGSMPMDSRLLVAAYALADIFVMPNVPTKEDTEGFGVVILEAWAAGACVVASRVDGLKYLINDGQDGLLIDPYDSDGFARGIVSLLEDDGLRKELQTRANRRVKSSYSWRVVARTYAELFGQLTQER